MYNPILEKRKEIIDNIQKSFEPDEDSIEKAKWQIGEVRVDSRGIAHECYEYTADGKPRLRRVRKNKGSTDSTDGGEKQIKVESKDGTNKISDSEFKKIVNILEKKNPAERGAERYLESEEMDDKQLDNFIEYAKKFSNDEENINPLTRRRCEVWFGLALEERKERTKLKQQQKKKEVDMVAAMMYDTKLRNAVESFASSELGNSSLDFSKMSKKKIGEIYEKLDKDKLQKYLKKVMNTSLKSDDQEKDLAEIPVNGRIRIEGVGYFKKVGMSDWVKFDPNTGKESDKRINYTKISDNGYAKGVTIVDSSGKSKENNKKK